MVYIIYKTDFQHSYASRDMIGVASSKDNAINIIEQQAVKDGDKISSDDMYNLQNIMQTQNHTGNYEFDYEKVEVDTLI